MTARISIRDEPSISLPPRKEVERLLALTTQPPSPLTPLPHIPSPPPNSPTYIEIPESCLPFRKRDETTSMYGIMEDAQDDRSQLRGRVNLLYKDRSVHRRLAVMIEREAKMAREAWGLSMDSSDYAHSDVMSLRTTVVAQSALIFRDTDHQNGQVFKRQNRPAKGPGDSQMHRRGGKKVKIPRFGYVVAMLCQPVK
ncbi:hypothetical protein Tco_1093759 [Tanacetum coccineum]|uniref:Uncharacterized protein n=1 Tax=Tanacetum coccineum TaxID=301880 RepID=A0ABQ5IDM2_9ASTR